MGTMLGFFIFILKGESKTGRSGTTCADGMEQGRGKRDDDKYEEEERRRG